MKKFILSIGALVVIFSLASCKKSSSSSELVANKDALSTEFYTNVITNYETMFDMNTPHYESSDVNYDESATAHYEVYLPTDQSKSSILSVTDCSSYTNNSKAYANYTSVGYTISNYSSIITILNQIDSISNYTSASTQVEEPENYLDTEASQRVLCVEYTLVFVKYVEYQDGAAFPTLYTCVLVPTNAKLTTLSDNTIADSSISLKYNEYYTFSNDASYVSNYELNLLS